MDLSENKLEIEISDALSEKEKVKFTVVTTTNNPAFCGTEFSVVRQHEEFIWLHDRFEEEPMYVGFIVSVTQIINIALDLNMMVFIIYGKDLNIYLILSCKLKEVVHSKPI